MIFTIVCLCRWTIIVIIIISCSVVCINKKIKANNKPKIKIVADWCKCIIFISINNTAHGVLGLQFKLVVIFNHKITKLNLDNKVPHYLAHWLRG